MYGYNKVAFKYSGSFCITGNWRWIDDKNGGILCFVSGTIETSALLSIYAKCINKFDTSINYENSISKQHRKLSVIN